MKWFHVNALSTHTYPSGDLSNDRDTTRTTTAADSDVVDAGYTMIREINIGPNATGLVRTLEFRRPETATLIREVYIDTSNSTQGHNANTSFRIDGAWSAFVTGGAGNVDIYIDYEAFKAPVGS